ncbi:hypothetical protein LAZ67_20001272 [Cordylochernes scorpioides]|uniref:Reverse transcriptase Ty1/copia-type domain-containing protein n=1 Tax=Cordylochernes scorpioides TaxID=51811 RepID=A0ABY6LMQ2_9ARAC|nr:hypothetical protein LAZ67_20001272 [Cordylochernes scorpioides]
MNGQCLLGLANKALAERLINEGLEVEGMLLKTFPFYRRAAKITIGNLPFFVKDASVIDALLPYGRVTSIVPKQLKAGKYVYTDGRREAFVVPHDGINIESIPARLDIRIKGEAWPMYLTSGIRCSRCRGQGHRKAKCPMLTGQSTGLRRASPPSTTNVPQMTAPELPRQASAASPAPPPPDPAMEVSGVLPAAPAAPHQPAVLGQPPPAPMALPMDISTPVPAPPAPSREKPSNGPTAHTAPQPAESTPPTPHKEESTPDFVTYTPPLLSPLTKEEKQQGELEFQCEAQLFDLLEKLNWEQALEPLFEDGIEENEVPFARCGDFKMEQKLKQRICIEFCVKLQISATKTFEMLNKHSPMTPQREQLFLNGILDLKLAEFPLKMILVKDAQNFKGLMKKKITDLIKENPRTTLMELEQDTGISKTTIGRIVTEDLKLKKTPAKFIPRFLTNEQKLCRLATCEDMMEMTITDPEWKDKIITGDETWVYGYDPETKPQSAEWRDIAPNDFFLFPKLKAVLKGRHFDTRDDIIEESPLALKSIPKEAYKNCFDNWEKRWRWQVRGIEVGGSFDKSYLFQELREEVYDVAQRLLGEFEVTDDDRGDLQLEMSSPIGEEYATLGLYVDDLIIAATSKKINDNLASEIEKYVTLTEKKDSEPFIGIEIKRAEDGFYLSQTHYIDTILHRFGLEECNSVQTPGDQNQNLDKYFNSKTVD